MRFRSYKFGFLPLQGFAHTKYQYNQGNTTQQTDADMVVIQSSEILFLGRMLGVPASNRRSSQPSPDRKEKFRGAKSKEARGSCCRHWQQESDLGENRKVNHLSSYIFSFQWLLLLRSETLAIPDCHDPVPEIRRSSKRRRLSGGSFRITPENMSNTSSGCGMDVRIEFESPNTPILERPTTLPEMNSRPASRVMKSFSVDEVYFYSQISPFPRYMLSFKGDIERQKRKTATAIVTSGALTFMILAAALVTASFLMSPVIEDVFGE